MRSPAYAKAARVPGALTCDFAADLERAKDIHEAMDALHGAVRTIGFDMVDYSYVPVCRMRDGQWTPPPLEKRNFPRGWDEKWSRHSTNDPYYHTCYNGRDLWVEWAEVQDRPDLSGAERDVIHFLDDQQMHLGVTIPIRLPVGQLAFVSGIGGRPPQRNGRVEKGAARDLFVLAHYFHHTVTARRLRPPRWGECALSQRELECLSWVARGKTAEATAKILGRSVETVRVHLKHAIAKLGAANCAHAVAKASFLRLIEP